MVAWGNALGGFRLQRRNKSGQFGFKAGGKKVGKGSNLTKGKTRLTKSQRRAKGLQKKKAAISAARKKNIKRVATVAATLAVAGGAVYAAKSRGGQPQSQPVARKAVSFRGGNLVSVASPYAPGARSYLTQRPVRPPHIDPRAVPSLGNPSSSPAGISSAMPVESVQATGVKKRIIPSKFKTRSGKSYTPPDRTPSLEVINRRSSATEDLSSVPKSDAPQLRDPVRTPKPKGSRPPEILPDTGILSGASGEAAIKDKEGNVVKGFGVPGASLQGTELTPHGPETMYSGINEEAGRNGKRKGVKPLGKTTQFEAPDQEAIAEMHQPLPVPAGMQDQLAASNAARRAAAGRIGEIDRELAERGYTIATAANPTAAQAKAHSALLTERYRAKKIQASPKSTKAQREAAAKKLISIDSKIGALKSQFPTSTTIRSQTFDNVHGRGNIHPGVQTLLEERAEQAKTVKFGTPEDIARRTIEDQSARQYKAYWDQMRTKQQNPEAHAAQVSEQAKKAMASVFDPPKAKGGLVSNTRESVIERKRKKMDFMRGRRADGSVRPFGDRATRDKDRQSRMLGSASNQFMASKGLLSSKQKDILEQATGKNFDNIRTEDVRGWTRLARVPNRGVASYQVFSEDDARKVRTPDQETSRNQNGGYNSRKRGRRKSGMLDQVPVITRADGMSRSRRFSPNTPEYNKRLQALWGVRVTPRKRDVEAAKAKSGKGRRRSIT